MKIEYKRLTENELDIFINMRIYQLREEGAREEIDLAPALKDYYNRHMADGTFVSWLAVDGDKIIGTSGMSFVEKPPYFGCPSGSVMEPSGSMYLSAVNLYAAKISDIVSKLENHILSRVRLINLGFSWITLSQTALHSFLTVVACSINISIISFIILHILQLKMMKWFCLSD